MGLIWPTRLNPAPNLFTRLGRVAHWIGLLLFTAALIGAAMVYQDERGVQTAEIFLGVGLLWYLSGRGVRYVLAGE